MSFHVPEDARNTWHPRLRTSVTAGNNGAFELPSPEPGWRLFFICSDCTHLPPGVTYPPPHWEHVSVHARRKAQMRTPSWKEMCFIKDLCWDPEDVVMQLHPKHSEYVNQHPHTLHLWRPVGVEIPTPPPEFVGRI